MPDRFAYYDPLSRYDRDEDGLPCDDACLALDFETPNEPVCRILYQWILEATTGHEVCEAYRAHEIECPVCKPAMKRAA
jgi:hypothetical protein